MSFVTSPVASIIVSNRFRKEPGDIQALAENIHEIGLLHPIAVTPDGRLIAGARRLMAFKYLGRTEIPVHVVDLDEIVRGEFAENVYRKSFLPSELDAIGQEISKLEAERARARQGTRRDLGENCHDVEFGKTRDKVATQLGTSGRNLDKIRYVMRAAEDDPERFGKYAKEMDETENVDRAYKQVQGQLNLDAKKNRPIVCPEGKFATIVCDPPWPIDKIRMEVNSDESEMDYETWTEEELPARLADLARFIDSKAVDECILWFWSTIRFQRIAEDAVEAWGWKRLPSGIWHKRTGMQPVGLPKWNYEVVVIARRGGAEFLTTEDFPLCFDGTSREHSRKPAEFYDRVRRVSPAPRLDMFNRAPIEGFERHGNEIDRFPEETEVPGRKRKVLLLEELGLL
jgi:N6-adenosine-specific RNA methylase IME4